MHHHDSVHCMNVTWPLNNSHRFLTSDKVWWPLLSLPTPKRDLVYCNQEHGVFTSPNCPFPPPFPLPKLFMSPEFTQTAAQADHTLPWLPMVPTALQFNDPLLDSLSLKPLRSSQTPQQLTPSTVNLKLHQLSVSTILQSLCGPMLKADSSSWLMHWLGPKTCSWARPNHPCPTNKGIKNCIIPLLLPSGLPKNPILLSTC